MAKLVLPKFVTPRRFGRDEDGAATIEALLWIPMMLIFFGILADALMIFSSQARALAVIQTGNRQLATGQLASCADVQTWVENVVNPMSPNAIANCTILRPTNVISTSLSMPATDVDIVGLLRSFADLDVVVSTQQVMEDLS